MRESILEFLDHLRRDGVWVSADAAEKIAKQTWEEEAPGNPWYIQIFIGGAAWFAFILIFFAFLFFTDLDEEAWLPLGIVLTAAALGIHYWRPNNIFAAQLALVMSLCGQGLVLAGFVELLEEPYLFLSAMVPLQLLLLFLFRQAIHRFLLVNLIGFFTLATFYALDREFASGLQEIGVQVLAGSLAAGIVWLALNERRWIARGQTPLVWPIMIGLSTALLGGLMVAFGENLLGAEVTWPVTAGVCLAIWLLAVYLIKEDLRLPWTASVPILLISIGGLSFWPGMNAPALMAGLLILLVGYWRQRLILIGLGAAGVVVALWLYFTLVFDRPLNEMSLILIGIGLGFLALYAVMNRNALFGRQTPSINKE